MAANVITETSSHSLLMGKSPWYAGDKPLLWRNLQWPLVLPHSDLQHHNCYCHLSKIDTRRRGQNKDPRQILSSTRDNVFLA